MMKFPAVSGAKRAIVNSLGPIAFGSLFLGIYHTIKTFFVGLLKLDSFFSGAISGVLMVINNAGRFMSSNSILFMAMHGNSLCDGSIRSWNLLSGTGFDAIVNNNIVGTIMIIQALFVGSLTSTLGYIALITVLPEARGFAQLLTLALFFSGYMIMRISGMIVQSGVPTL